MDTSAIKVGRGMTRETGYEVGRLGCRRVMVLTDPRVASLAPVTTVMASLDAEGIDATLFDRVAVEPTDKSFNEAIAFARAGDFDGYVAVGGGSTIDTAKAANLYATYPADLLTYVTAPLGEGKAVPGPLKPLVAVPTTSGTGSETTGVAILDIVDRHTKTAIASRALRPSVGIIDPDNAATLPPMIAASSGLDVLCHGLESYTALPFNQRPAPISPASRTTYQGANPISDIWCRRAVEMVAEHLVGAIAGVESSQAEVMLAATYAGIGFGNAGVHLCHAMSYGVAGQVKSCFVDGYPRDRPLVPHGISVVLTAPAIFRWTASSDPGRHLAMAEAMGANLAGVPVTAAGECLADRIIAMMRQTGMPNGLAAIGYAAKDIDALVDSTLPQTRIIALSPRAVDAPTFRQLFLESMSLW
jgi:hydroxyacid-oxoacid transhydrogenase